jgi:hypothetical protein
MRQIGARAQQPSPPRCSRRPQPRRRRPVAALLGTVPTVASESRTINGFDVGPRAVALAEEAPFPRQDYERRPTV